MRKNDVKVKTMVAVLMIYVMAFLTACGGGDVTPLPTSMAEESMTETVETKETTDIQMDAEYSNEVTAAVETDLVADMSGTETDTAEIDTDTEDETESVEETDDSSVAETDTDVDTDAEKQPETPKTAEPVVTPAQEEVKPVHTHSYTGNITVNPSCEGTGIMTYVCRCGNSYAEPIVVAGHQWTTTTETVHHPSMGRVERTEKKITTIQCGCGFTTESEAEFQAHCVASLKAWTGDILRCPCGGNEKYVTRTEYVDEWVVTQAEYDEIVTKTVCSVCGAVQ